MKIPQIMDNNPYANLLYSLRYVFNNILQGWIKISYAYSWFGLNLHTQAKPPLQFWNKEKEDECHKTDLQQKHSLIVVDEQINKLQAMSKTT